MTLKELYETQHIYDNILILNNKDWSKFDCVVDKGVQEVIKVTYNNKSIVCTPDHLIWSIEENKYKPAHTFVYENILKKQHVYDIVNVENGNCFYCNDILVHNCLILDEFAFISPGEEEGFLNSVMPVVSSSKTSQIIVVSTPNGMNNEYYRIWNRAQLDLGAGTDGLKWTPVRIDWYDVPGRDEKWKQEQLLTFNRK